MTPSLSDLLAQYTDCTAPECFVHVKAAIFDMDGTLLDSMSMWRNVPFLYLEKKGVRTIPDREQLWNEFKVVSLQDAAHIFQRDYGFTESVETIVEEIDDVVFDQYAAVIKAKPGAKAFLSALKNADIPRGMATATDRRCVQAALRHLRMVRLISTIATCSEAGASKDKNPAVYDMIAARFGFARNECVIFEDALHGVRTAKAAGYSVIAVRDQSTVDSGEWQEIECLADAVLGVYQK